jgi:hypothetical protein
MSKEKQDINQLAHKYFWEQKREELGKASLVFMGIYGTFGFTAIIYEFLKPFIPNPVNPFNWLVFIIGLIPIIFWIIYGLIYWINSNWEIAYRRAQEDIK